MMDVPLVNGDALVVVEILGDDYICTVCDPTKHPAPEHCLILESPTPHFLLARLTPQLGSH